MPAAEFHWRAMTADDFAQVSAVAAEVHPGCPEDDAVFAERLLLYPAGCFVLAGSQENAANGAKAGIAGYLISHPWHFARPPALDMLLGVIPSPATTYYIHDIALLPAAHGAGAASAVVATLASRAKDAGMPNLSLVAVNGSFGFWQRRRFAVVNDPALDVKLASYGDDARYMVRELAG